MLNKKTLKIDKLNVTLQIVIAKLLVLILKLKEKVLTLGRGKYESLVIRQKYTCVMLKTS